MAAPFRGMGFGRLMHEYVERYFRSWDVREIELHVSPNNVAALERTYIAPWDTPSSNRTDGSG